MARMAVLIVCMGLVGLAAGKESFPACPYCSCKYGDEEQDGFNITEHYLPGKNMTDSACQNWCLKYHPYHYFERSCMGDGYPTHKTCSSPCWEGGDSCGSLVKPLGNPKGFCAKHNGTCKLPMTSGYMSPKCTSCFTCECKFGMGTIPAPSSHGVVDDATCKALCRGPEFGNGNYTKTWMPCGCANGSDCVVYWPCDGGCTDNGSYCQPGGARCSADSTGTRCTCEIQGSSPAKGCGLPAN